MENQRIAKHKYVQFTYSITDDSGSVVEQVDIPLTYVHGTDNGMFEKIERALEGCRKDDVIDVELMPEEGFGSHDPVLTFTDDIDNVPPEFRSIGAEVQMQNDQGETKTFIVSKIENGKLTVDGNHPLAGKRLTFKLKINNIRDATTEEIEQGRLPGEMLTH